MERTGTSANAYSCYSSLLFYGSGQFNPIVSPYPATLVPSLYTIARPHKMPQLDIDKKDACCSNCSGYKRMDQYCDSRPYLS